MRRRRRLRLGSDGHDDPLHGVANLFDLGIVFALGFMLALLARFGVQRLEGTDPEGGEVVPETVERLTRYREGDGTLSGRGVRLGTAFRLDNGDVVYVPGE